MNALRFILKQSPNAVVRLLSFDRYYICDLCHKVHKSNDNDLDLCCINSLKWYQRILFNKVSYSCYKEQQNRVKQILMEALYE